MRYPAPAPFNLGNVLGQAENILASRARRDPNSLQNQLMRARVEQIQNKATMGGDPTSNMRDIMYLREMEGKGYSPEEIELFKQAVAKGYGWMSDPTLRREVNARGDIKGMESYVAESAKQAAQLGEANPWRPVSTEELSLAPQMPVTSKAEIAAKTKSAEGIATREQGYVTEGLAAADSLSTIKRGIDLLESGVKTGGWDNLKLWATDALGITGGDEGELSANLGKAVLSQLRATFGAQFTEREGARLERIEAGFGKSPAVNLRLLSNILQIVEKSAKRGMAAAKASGDDFTYNEIKKAMEATLDEYRAPSESTGWKVEVIE